MSGKMIETGSRISRKGLVGALAVAGLCMLRPAAAHGQLIESFENTLDGWTFNPTFNTQQLQDTFSSTTGVTNGSFSLEVEGGATARTLNGPDYGNLLISPRSAGLAATLASAGALEIDYFNPQALPFGPQIDVDIDDGGGVAGGTGFATLDGFSYPTPAGGESTAIYLLTPALQASLAADAASTGVDIVIQVGGGAPATTNLPFLYIDNVRAAQVPEPASLSLLALGATGLLARRRKA